jgi:hypothetical protein
MVLLNGREIIVNSHAPPPQSLFDGNSGGRYIDDSFAFEALRGEIYHTPVSDLFFSANNINALQQGIRYSVYRSSEKHHIIGRQSDVDLILIMKGVYLEHAMHLSGNTVGQVKGLNARVLDYVVPRVLTEVDTYLKYRHDVSTLPVPMERAPMMSQKGTRVLEQRRF